MHICSYWCEITSTHWSVRRVQIIFLKGTSIGTNILYINHGLSHTYNIQCESRILSGGNAVGFQIICHNLSWLTHWGPVTHICVDNLTIIGSDKGLSPGRCQAIIWTNADILLIRSQGTYFNGISFEFHIFSFRKMHLNMPSAKCRPFCLGEISQPWIKSHT